MVNQKGEYPKSEVINMRVHPRIKRKAKELPYSYAEIFEIGCDKLAKEINLLMYQKGELELDIANLKKEVHSKEANLTAINNRIRIINPRKLDKETLDGLINDSARDYATDIFNAHGENSLMRIELDQAKHAVLTTAREWGYDGTKFLNLVRDNLKKLCNTKV
ncbi:hypothetical protein [Methanobrevibacter gottschalkii]|uniref:hypothetical protein n=1 Tax=Methanobrevibacter gottschalkii TaxID=190974 RepID=UPI000B80D956|nr:hypothetical protein [Methanobrevibacter gottschalkii]